MTPADVGDRAALGRLCADIQDVTGEEVQLAYVDQSYTGEAAAEAAHTAVYRFFDSAHGTHLFTQNTSERASILATRPDLVSEGIAF